MIGLNFCYEFKFQIILYRQRSIIAFIEEEGKILHSIIVPIDICVNIAIIRFEIFFCSLEMIRYIFFL